MSNPHRKARRVKRYRPKPVHAPMLVASALVLGPLEAIVDRLEIDGTVDVDGKGNPVIQDMQTGEWYDAAGGIEAFKKHFASLHEDRFSDPLYEPSRLAFVAGFLVAHEAALYAVPIATPEHDAKVRDAALEEAARCADAHSGRPVAGEVMAHAIRYLKSTGADHE